MDVESPEHLERLRSQPEIKAAYLRLLAIVESPEARFERAAKNDAYWPFIDEVAARFMAARRPANLQEACVLYERPYQLLAVTLGPGPDSPYIIALAAADDAPTENLIALLRSVCHDYWYGSYFWK